MPTCTGAWLNLGFVERSPLAERYRDLAHRIDETLSFMAACGMTMDYARHARDRFLRRTRGATAAARAGADPRRSDHRRATPFGISCGDGDRTRQAEGGHVEFMRGVKNPIGMKCGPSLAPDDLVRILDIEFNPDNVPGRMTLISRMGADKIAARLPPLVRAVQRSGHKVVWITRTDGRQLPITVANNVKTRRFDAILSEVRGFDIHTAEGTWAGGACRDDRAGRHRSPSAAPTV